MSDVDLVEPLTPNHLLTQKTKLVLPLPGSFTNVDAYCRQRWRRAQFLADQFWSRWRTDFLPTLQERRKWTATQPSVRPGDIVLLMEEETPRKCWPLGRVKSTLPSGDGKVRKVKLSVRGTELERPIHKLISIVKSGDPCSDGEGWRSDGEARRRCRQAPTGRGRR